jgi:hypothetical protein
MSEALDKAVAALTADLDRQEAIFLRRWRAHVAKYGPGAPRGSDLPNTTTSAILENDNPGQAEAQMGGKGSEEAKLMAVNQPRIPAGSPDGGEWVNVGGEKMYPQGEEGRARGGAGTLGINERIYRGGQFLPSTTEQRIEQASKVEAQRMRAYMARKQEVGPYEWATPPHPDVVPLTRFAKPGIFTTYEGEYKQKRMVLAEWGDGKHDPPGVLRQTDDEKGTYEGRPWRVTAQMYADAWNAGNRWVYNPSLGEPKVVNAV